MRKRYAALRRGSWDTVHLDERSGVYAYVRRLEQGEEPELACALNLGGAAQTVSLPPYRRYAVLHATRATERGGPGVSGSAITLPAVSGVVVARLPE